MDDGLLDTTFFVDALRGDGGALLLLDRIVTNDFRGYFSPVSVVELSSSPYYSQSEDSFFHGLFARLKEVPFDLRAARLAGLYLRDMPAPRAERLFRDAMIGTTATVSGLPCYTRNIRDMMVFAASVRRY